MSEAKVNFIDEDWNEAAPGAEVFFGFACPLHAGRRCEFLPIRGRTTGGGDTWEWDGNREAPTFSPSVNHKSCWHGYVEKGRCVSTSKVDEPEPTT